LLWRLWWLGMHGIEYLGEERQQFLWGIEARGLPRDYMLDPAREASSYCLRLLPKLHDKGSRGGERPLRLRGDRSQERLPSRSCLHKVSLSCVMQSS
jgi:hypothetical protein